MFVHVRPNRDPNTLGAPTHAKKVFFSIFCYYVYIVKMTKTTQNKLVEFETTHVNIHNFRTCGGPIGVQIHYQIV